ncbi:hypothetical protein C1H46_029124 [Malus baccata]|uniref:Uncharacterized protein n=1 Tax=Malus baccata TaxID=106549 RepID=A0A540LFR9_MALBA|nr:hypothetical protein C1H46_029124 [Malus baccata]
MFGDFFSHFLRDGWAGRERERGQRACCAFFVRFLCESEAVVIIFSQTSKLSDFSSSRKHPSSSFRVSLCELPSFFWVSTTLMATSKAAFTFNFILPKATNVAPMMGRVRSLSPIHSRSSVPFCMSDEWLDFES